jgi:signal transduction histidine kinase
MPFRSDEPDGGMPELVSSSGQRCFPEMAHALHASVGSTVRAWRARSVETMPHLHELSIVEFENSISTILHALANAIERGDPASLHNLMEQSPAHGVTRFLQHCGPETLLAEERILRSVVVIELRRTLRRPPTANEAAALHNLLDMMAEQSLLALMNKRSQEHEKMVQSRVSGMQRLADLGTLVAGVAHDAANMLLPLRMRLEHLSASVLTPEARDDLTSIELIFKQFQNSIVNLRWLSVDSVKGFASPSSLRQPMSLRLDEWAAEASDFHGRMLSSNVRLRIDVPSSIPAVAITSAALSQAVFNLIHNASQAIAFQGEGATGTITIKAVACGNGSVNVVVEDDGPGMSPEVLRRSTEPFFTTRASGSGLGLALVQALILGCGGSLTLLSPPPERTRGTAVILTLPVAEKP